MALILEYSASQRKFIVANRALFWARDMVKFRDMIIIGTKFLVWGSQLAAFASHCGQCGVEAPFIIKKGMRFITIFFVIPVIPISGVSEIRQCPNCGTRYQP